MCTFPSPGIQARPSVRAPMRAAWLLVATGGLALAGVGLALLGRARDAGAHS